MIFLLSGMISFLNMAVGNLSIQDNPKEISLSPIACFLLGIGFVGFWLLIQVPNSQSNPVLLQRRFYVSVVMLGISVFGMEFLWVFAKS